MSTTKTVERAVAEGLAETDITALTLHHEASGEGLVGMLGVGFVLKNRARWGLWGPTLRDVCLAPGQFSCWSPVGGGMNHVRLIGHVAMIRRGTRPVSMSLAYEAVEALFVFDGLSDFTNQADHYYAPRSMQPPGSKPAWVYPNGDCTQPELTPSAVIRGHRFYTLRRS